MTPMHREKQWDMFDVAIGACTLEDYLFQRYSENDLASTFWIDAKDEVDELRPPKPTPDGQPGTEPEVIPIQGPRADKKKAEEAAAAAAAAAPAPAAASPESPSAEPAEAAPPVSQAPVTADGQDTRASSSTGPEVPSLESFKSGGMAPQPSSQESYRPQSASPASPAPSLEKVDLSGETNSTPSPPTPVPSEPQAPEVPKPPSMEELLARFHQATKDHKERIFTEEEAAGGEPPSEGPGAEPTSEN